MVVDLDAVLGHDQLVDFISALQFLSEQFAVSTVVGMAQGLIGFVASPIEGGFDATGRILAEELGDFFCNEGGIGVDGQHKAHLLEGDVEFPEVGIKQRFSPGEEQEQGALLFQLAGNGEPFVLAFHSSKLCGLPGLHANVTHVAIQIADGCEFECSRDGNLCYIRFMHQPPFNGVGVLEDVH